MKNTTSKFTPVFSLTFKVDKDSNILQDATLKEGYEHVAAETLFKMSQGLISQSLLAVINSKYPNIAELVNAEIEMLANQFLVMSGQKAWLNAPAVDVENVFGGRPQAIQGQ